MTFEALGLRAELLRTVAQQGFTEPTAIQQQAIPAILAGRDLLASARTGSGKTAAFCLPLIQMVGGKQRSGPLCALVLTPTRELAAQVHESFRAFSSDNQPQCAAVYGGINIHPQISRLRRGVDVLVATPGRLIDLMQRGCVKLDGLHHLVLDEADRMLDMGFLPAVERIVSALPARRQTLLFSATLSGPIQNVAARFMCAPLRIEAAPAEAAARHITQQAIMIDQERKRELLSWMIGHNNWQQVLIFTRTKHGANRLTAQLELDGIKAVAIHGNKTQGARSRALADFKQRKVRALVATDIAARGLDIEHLPHVINYEVPQTPDDYIHRIGRTGRAGREGVAISLVAGAERRLFDEIRRQVKAPIANQVIAGYEPTQTSAKGAFRLNGAAQRKAPQAAHRQGAPKSGRNGPHKRRPKQHRGAFRQAA